MKYETRVVTQEGQFARVNLEVATDFNGDGRRKFRLTFLISKDDVKTNEGIDFALREAKRKGSTELWNGKEVNVALPIHDGDALRADGSEYDAAYKGHWFIHATCSDKYPPEIYDISGRRVVEPGFIQAGDYGRVALVFVPYMFEDRCGVCAYISGRVMKTRDGERLGIPTAADDFGFGRFQVYDEELPF